MIEINYITVKWPDREKEHKDRIAQINRRLRNIPEPSTGGDTSNRLLCVNDTSSQN